METGLLQKMVDSTQEFITFSVLNSLLLSGLLGVLIFVFEQRNFKNSKKKLYLLYQLSLAVLFFFPFLGSIWLMNRNSFLPRFIEIKLSKDELYLWISIIWSMGVMVYLIRLFISEIYLNKIIRESEAIFPSEWLNLLNKVKQTLNYSKKVLVVHSSSIHSAFLSGLIKPVLIIPTSWVNQISLEDAKFILLHELAHLKNKDHYINTFCTLAEVVYFFNPIIHYLTKRIRFQRELCVDQSVVQHTNLPLQYAHCLIRIGEKNVMNRSINFGSIPNQLSYRVKSILHIDSTEAQRNKSFRNSFAVTIIMFGIFLTLINPLYPVNETNSIEHDILSAKCDFYEEKDDIKKSLKSTKQNIKPTKNTFRKVHNKIVIDSSEIELVTQVVNYNSENIRPIFNNKSREIKIQDSMKIQILVNPQPSHYSSGYRIAGINNKHYFEKDWKYKIQGNKKVYSYIIINESGKTILSYNGTTFNLNQISNIN